MNCRKNIPIALLFTALMACHRQETPPPDADRFHVNFRTEPNFEQSFRLIDPEQRKYISAVPEGLRFDVPDDVTNQPVAIMLKRTVTGDFAATINYELLKAEADGQWGSGFQFFLQLDRTPDGDGLTIARQARGNGQMILFQHMTTRDGKRVPMQTKVVSLKETAPAGAFSVRRTGAQLEVNYSTGGGPMQEMGKFEVGDGPVAVFRIGVNPEAQGSFPVEARVLDLDLTTAGPMPAEPVRRPPFLTTLIVIAVLIGAGLILWAVRRLSIRRRAVAGSPGGRP